ncbi:hypothetical protein KI387_000142, partial [Taxus chinensis]
VSSPTSCDDSFADTDLSTPIPDNEVCSSSSDDESTDEDSSPPSPDHFPKNVNLLLSHQIASKHVPDLILSLHLPLFHI